MRKIKLFLACLLMAVLSIGQVWGADPVASSTMSAIATANSWVTASGSGTQTCYTSFNLDANISISTTGSANCGSFWGEDWRLYQNQSGNVTVTALNGCTLKDVTFTYGIKNTGVLKDGTTNINSGSKTSLSGTSKTFTVGNTGSATNGQVKITAISVTYIASTPSYTINAESNNTTYGTVSLTGSVITATRNPGYRYATPAYTVTSGTATVAQSGDAFTVTPSTDCTVRINFEPIPTHNIIFNNGGVKVIANAVVAEGASYDITEAVEDALIASCTYKKFEGWTLSSSIDPSAKPALVSSVTMEDDDVNLYAVYSVTSGSGSSITEETASVTMLAYATVHSWVDATQYATVEMNDDITATAAGGGNTGKYYENGNEWRFYGSESATITIAAADGCTLKSITPTFTTKSSGVLKDGETTLTSGTPYEISGTSKTLSIEVGQVKFTAISVTYDKTTSGTTTFSLDAGCAAAGQCFAPTFSPAAGTFDAAQSIELATTTAEAVIYYTTNGNDPEPGEEGTSKYTSAISVTQNTTIKAIATKGGMDPSEVATGEFKIRFATAPTFGPTEGDYTSAQSVTMAATGAEHIYYTMTSDGSTPADPTIESPEYTTAIPLNANGTYKFKAIAVKAGFAPSNVTSATYTLDLPYANIAAFITAKPATAKSLTLNNAIITGVDGTTLYVQDETAGIMIYGLASLPENAAPNHSISGTIVGKYSLYKHQHELVKPNNTTPIDISNVTISADEVARPAINEYTSLNAAYAAKPMMLVKLTDVSYDGTEYEFDGNKIYNTFGALTDKTMPETTVDCDITGVVIDYNGTLELLPVFATDIVADADAADPTVSPAGGADAENAVTAAAVEITAAADTKVDGLASKTVDINSANPTEVTVEVTRDFYRTVNYSCGYYKAAAAKYNINGQGATPKGTVVAKVAGVEAATAAEGDEVHVFITPNAHFHFESITINKNEGTVATTQVAEGTEYSFTMPDEAVTIAVTYTQDQQATLTFAKGEATGTEDAPTAITDYVGETVQLPANPFTYNGYKFIGWSCDDGANKLAAGADYVLSENKAFVAYWEAIPTFNDADHEWQLATSLEAGKYYVIGSASQDKTASKAISSGYMGELDTEIEDGVIAYNALNANTAIFLLGGNSTDGWTLTEVTTDNVLGTTGNKNVSWNAGTQTWAISIAEGGNATIGGTSRILHNVDSNTSAMMLLPQLYVWTEKVFKLRYDANGGTNAPAATLAVAGKATVTDEQPTAPTGKIFDGWNENATGTGEDYVAGDEISITSADVTIFAKWRDPYTFTVSYDANEGEGTMDADADQEEGSLYTIKPNEFTREGYGFAGWKAYDALDNELTITNGEFYIPTSNVTVKAQWNEIVTTNFVLVGNVNQLNAGDEVYIVAAASNNAMGAQDNVNYRSRVEIGKTADNGRVIITGTAPVMFTLGKVGENFTFFDGEGYLCATSSSNNYMGTQIDLDDNGKWSISINANGEATIIAQGNFTRNHMRYNDNNNQERFSCYASTSTMPKVAIYKKASAEVIRGELSNGKWGTICPKQTVENATGATFYQISYLEEQNGLPFNMVFDPITGTTLTAGQPYFFIATGEEITGIKVGVELSEADDAGVNGFYGYIGDGVKALSWKTDYVAGEDNTFVIYNNTVMRLNAATNLKSERCYININATEPTRVDPTPGAAPRRRVVVGVSGTNVATGIDALNASETPVKMIIDGQLFIIRGEKMYNVNGQVVK